MKLEDAQLATWREALAHYAQLIELPKEQRAQALETTDVSEAVRNRILELIQSDDQSSSLDNDVSFLVKPNTEEDLSGQIVGPWRLQKEIGRGGMAVVYLAEREGAAFEQTAAIKLLPRGTVGQTHFVREQQVLAKLEHPNIARLLDGGVSQDGTPWLAMEYVDGLRIDQYCKNQSNRDKVQLLLQVIDAVAYAHRHLIVHRDLKPGNILVDTDGRVRLLDFGIARLLSEHDGPATRVMTPEYAAPEQFDGSAISTATDVFGLAGVLHKLLSGEAPRSADGKRSTAFNKSDCDQDLKNIVSMALRDEPESRYATAQTFGEDLQRWLRSMPVLATQGSRRYRIRKWLQRHSLAVAAASVVFLAILGAVGGVFWQAKKTQQQAQLVHAQNEFLKELLASPQSVARGRQVQVIEVLADSIEKLDQRFPTASMARAELFATLGRSMKQLDDPKMGVQLWRRAVDDLTELKTTDAEKLIGYKLGLAETLVDAGESPEAREILGKIEAQAKISIAKNHFLHPAIAIRSWLAWEHHDAERAAAFFELAQKQAQTTDWLPSQKAQFECARIQGLMEYGKFHDTVQAAEKFLAWAVPELGEKHSNILCAYQAMSFALGSSGDLPRAEATARDAERIAVDWLGAEDRTVYTLRLTLANLIQEQGRFSEALEIYQQLIDDRETYIGISKTDHNVVRQGIAVSLMELGQYADAEPVLREVIQNLIDEKGADFTLVLVNQINLAELLIFSNRAQSAMQLANSTYIALEKKFGEAHPVSLAGKSKIGGVLVNTKKPTEALALLDGLDVKLAEFFGADDPNVISAKVWRAQALLALQRSAEAQPLLESGYAWRLSHYGKEHPLTLKTQQLLEQAQRESK